MAVTASSRPSDRSLTTLQMSPLRALELLAFGACSAPNVAAWLRIDRRTARRLMERMLADGWVVRVPGSARPRLYRASFRVIALAAQATSRSPLLDAAVPLVSDLACAAQAPAYLAIPCYRDVLILADSGAQCVMRRGDLAPATSSAAGLALLASRDRWRESVLESMTEQERRKLDARLATVRANGYAQVALTNGLVAVASPLARAGVEPSENVPFAAVGLVTRDSQRHVSEALRHLTAASAARAY